MWGHADNRSVICRDTQTLAFSSNAHLDKMQIRSDRRPRQALTSVDRLLSVDNVPMPCRAPLAKRADPCDTVAITYFSKVSAQLLGGPRRLSWGTNQPFHQSIPHINRLSWQELRQERRQRRHPLHSPSRLAITSRWKLERLASATISLHHHPRCPTRLLLLPLAIAIWRQQHPILLILSTFLIPDTVEAHNGEPQPF